MRVCLSYRVNTLINLHFGFSCNWQSNGVLSVLALMGELHLSWNLVPDKMEHTFQSYGINRKLNKRITNRLIGCHGFFEVVW